MSDLVTISRTKLAAFCQQFANHLELSDAVINHCQERAKEAYAEKSAAESQVAGVVDQLATLKLITPQEKAAAVKELSTHAGTMETLKTACQMLAESQQKLAAAEGHSDIPLSPGKPDGSVKQAGRYKAYGMDEPETEKSGFDGAVGNRHRRSVNADRAFVDSVHNNRDH